MTTNYFARYIGLPRGENLYQIKRGNNGISRDVADKIVSKFPQIDKLWVLTGEGQMFAAPELRGATIPYYNADVEQAVLLRDRLAADTGFVLPQVVECDFAMRYEGRAMGAALPAGAIIPVAEYVIISRKIVTLRIVRTGAQAGEFRLVAGDKENFDDIVLKAKDIEAVYKVVGKLIINQ